MRSTPPLSVIKIGGGLAAEPGALDRVCAAVRVAAGHHRVLVVPGGGVFADAVREFAGGFGLSADAAHWMAILGMDQYAHALADRIPGSLLVDEPGGIVEAVQLGQVAILAPYRWMRSADVLPHSWQATSDSIAAFVAGALDAARLILIKPAAAPGNPVDSCFAGTLPAGLPYWIVPSDRLEELGRRLSG